MKLIKKLLKIFGSYGTCPQCGGKTIVVDRGESCTKCSWFDYYA